MTSSAQHSTLIMCHSLRGLALAMVLVYALALIGLQAAQAQAYTVLHSFCGGSLEI
jgi:hypothetical protein